MTSIPYAFNPAQARELQEQATDAQRQIEERFLCRPWREAAAEYFGAQREAGRAEMSRLLEALGLQAPVPTAEVLPLLEQAVQLFLGVAPGDAWISETDKRTFSLEVTDCPIYHRLLGAPGGQTACSCFSRRAGWYFAMGHYLVDEPETSLKWGDPSCRVSLHLE